MEQAIGRHESLTFTGDKKLWHRQKAERNTAQENHWRERRAMRPLIEALTLNFWVLPVVPCRRRW